MERLTEKDHVYQDYEFMEDGMAAYINKLAEYENTGLTPKDIMMLKEAIHHFLNKQYGKFLDELPPSLFGKIDE